MPKGAQDTFNVPEAMAELRQEAHRLTDGLGATGTGSHEQSTRSIVFVLNFSGVTGVGCRTSSLAKKMLAGLQAH